MTTRAQQFRDLFLTVRIAAQRDYYVCRSAEYRKAHEQAVIVRNVLLLAASITGGAAPFVPPTVRAGLGVAGAVLGALAAAITAFETLIGFPQLEKLYADAARNLREAEIDWHDVDPTADLTDEVERVEDIFRSERGQWGQLVVRTAAPARDRPSEERPAAPDDPPGRKVAG
jgi:hypothetical protein